MIVHQPSIIGLNICVVDVCVTSGLSLTFNTDQDEYIGNLAESVGVRVVVHSQSRMPFPEDEGIAAGTGMYTFIGITKVE